MACACLSEREKPSMRAALAMSAVRELRIVVITASKWSRAMVSPSKICARASAFASSYFVRRVMTSS